MVHQFERRWQHRQKAAENKGTSLTFESGLDVNAAVGRRFKDVRAEAEFSFFNSAVKSENATIPAQFGLARLEERIVDICRRPDPAHHQPELIDQQAQLAANDPAMNRPSPAL